MTFKDEKFVVKNKILYPSFWCEHDILLKKDTPKAFAFIEYEHERAILGELIDNNLVIYNLLHFLNALIDTLSQTHQSIKINVEDNMIKSRITESKYESLKADVKGCTHQCPSCKMFCELDATHSMNHIQHTC